MHVTIRWETRLEHIASVDVDELAIASWAVRALPIGTLAPDEPRPPTVEELQEAMARNGHLRIRLTQLYVIAHGGAEPDPTTRRDGTPTEQN
ncbi:hypothetical protein ACH3VR_22165 [Microbacterium sp. B2969]|uniref:Uncharacterized protein n=1 Tax=Microbacterium alkaliflavum TaxID=3248839 RepID=A0ABW7QDV8_9MICO